MPKKIKNKKNKTITIIVLTILVIVIIWNLVLLSSKFQNNTNVLAYSEIDVFFMIAEKHGFAIEDNFLHFGMVPPGGGSNKEITLNPINRPVKVFINVSKNISEQIKIEKNNFLLNPKDLNTTIPLKLTNTNNLSKGNYTGKLQIYYLKT